MIKASKEVILRSSNMESFEVNKNKYVYYLKKEGYILKYNRLVNLTEIFKDNVRIGSFGTTSNRNILVMTNKQ